MRVYRIPFSTNVERVSLALGHKGLAVEWVEVDPANRKPVQAVSGQPLVPVLVDGEKVIVDSMEIVRYLEEQHPAPSLYPDDVARRAELEIFVDWFNRVWKRAPNEIEGELGKSRPDFARIESLGAELQGALDLFEAMLARREYLMGDFSAADCAAFPFLKYALLYDLADDELFHRILRDYQRMDGGFARLREWIERVDAHPRA